MNPLPLASIRLRWSSHFSALRWLGLLYRRPQQFQAALSTCTVREQLVTAFWLLVHSAPYVLVIPTACRWLEASLNRLEFHPEPLFAAIAVEIAGGIVGWIIRGIVGGLAFGMAVGLAIGIGFGMAIGIAAGIVGGIGFRIGGMASGIAIAGAVASAGWI